MIKNLKSHHLFFRDGTSQQDRDVEALHPDYIQVEGRSIKELITDAQALAKELRFFDETNKSKSGIYWDSFLVENGVDYISKQPIEQKILREQWANQLAAYVEDPDRFLNDEKKQHRLSQPHVVLFLTFLKLLNHVKSQINGLTQKHLDFYFRERLGLTPKNAVPDVVNILFELIENIDGLEIKKDTVLLAGVDEEGNKLHYKTDKDTVVSKAKIAQLKNVFIDKQRLTIKDVHLNNRNTPHRGVIKMMEMALGHPNPGDPLPDLPEGVATIFELEPLIKGRNPNALSYVTTHLFLSVQEFERILQKNQEEKDGIPTDWEEVYTILDSGYKNKTKHKRQLQLKELHTKKGFDTVLKQVYGNPNPGDDLPLYKGNQASLTDVFEDFKSSNVNVSNEASEYIKEELKLKELDFIHIIRTSTHPRAKEEDWNKVYRLLELINRQIRGISIPAPILEKTLDVYANKDAKTTAFSQYGDEDESNRFRTFGNKQPHIHQQLPPAKLGFAISSPTLLLKEGKRTITALLDFGLAISESDAFESIFNNREETFDVYLSSEEEWFQPAQTSLKFGNYISGQPESEYGANNVSLENDNSRVIITKKQKDFDELDLGKYLFFPDNDGSKDDGHLYQITKVRSANELDVDSIGSISKIGNTIQKFPASQVSPNTLKVVIDLLEKDLPVMTPASNTNLDGFIKSKQPTLVFLLRHHLKGLQGRKNYQSSYQKLMQLALHKVLLNVEVDGLKNIVLQNDQNTIDAKKPFEPFGFEPEIGNNLYIANEEISQKKLSTLNLDLKWIKHPENFKEYYKNYWLVDADNATLDENAYTIKTNDDFVAQLYLCENNAEKHISPLKLFSPDGETSNKKISELLQMSNYQYLEMPEISAEGKDDVTDWDRYFKLELDPLDFQHSLYNTLFVQQAISEHEAIKKLKINTPYQPKAKRIQLGYTAQTLILPEATDSNNHHTLYHLHPFGFEKLKSGEVPSLLPVYKDEGTLYLGIAELTTPQVLSVLFQMAEGSANPDVEKPAIQWCYLRNNEWIPLATAAILSDTTNGLVNTGIMQIRIPGDATTGGTLLSDALHWLKVSASANITGISDTIAISAQVISATLASEVVSPSHFKNPLAPNTISETLAPIPEIKNITQPYTSSKGKPAEQGAIFYKRLSERLRHKNRAITTWDYEHMVLDKFPQVYKVKCLASTDQLGKVAIVVVPDIRKNLPFNPFAPKVASDTLFQIRKFLDNHSPASAEIAVHNPSYLQILTRCTVQFNPEYDTHFYKEKLIDEIKQFLSPWAYNQDSDIRIGGNLHASVLINFIAERPYIDYVANLKLFQSEDGKTFTDVRSINNGKSIVVPSRPDTVMVSGATHFIDIVDENGYDENSFEGINYMQIQLDFEVAKDLTQSLSEL
ncbi:baseplate J/gp47 family protein [Ascidiimonas sp. W6]|uniref:baseplate J/gp47 family protein n=1 Tax=Ascidiimonas meishanensis TaxID=3128903 RepID=UPI0030EB98D1